MPKKTGKYEALVALDSLSLNKIIHPGEMADLTPEDAEILLRVGAVKEIEDDTDDRITKLGKQQD